MEKWCYLHPTSISQQLEQQTYKLDLGQLWHLYCWKEGIQGENKIKNRYMNNFTCELFVLILQLKLSISHQHNKKFVNVADTDAQ